MKLAKGLFAKVMNLSLRWKLALAFGVILVALLIVSVVGWRAIRHSSEGFSHFHELASDLDTCADLQTDILMMRMNAKDFIITVNSKDIEEFDHYYQAMEESLAAAKKSIQNPERAKLVQKISDNVDDYEKAFRQVVEYMNRRNDLVYNKLNVIGPQMEQGLTEIMRSAQADNDLSAAYHAGVALRHLLLARLYVVKFLDTNSIEDAERVRSELAAMDKEEDILNQELQNPHRRKVLAQVMTQANQYHEAFEELVTTITERNKVIQNQLDKIGPEIAHAIDSVRESVAHDQAALGAELARANEIANWEIILTAIIGTVLSVGIAWILGLVIVRAVNSCKEAVTALAEQDFSKHADVQYGDELGQMAQAINRSIDNTKKAFDQIREAMEREQKLRAEQAEQEARRREQEKQQQERERRQAEELRRKVQHLLEVVNAAAQGDLTREAVVDGDGVVDELAAGINRMIADLRNMIGQISEAADQFAEGARVIADSSQTLAQGAQTQSSNVEEINAAIEQLTRSIDAVKASVEQADSMAQQANELAQQGGQTVKQ